jgi:hypothetical protein
LNTILIALFIGIIAVLTAIPIMLIVFPQDPKALMPIFIFSIILGAGVGFTGARFIA